MGVDSTAIPDYALLNVGYEGRYSEQRTLHTYRLLQYPGFVSVENS